MKEELKERTQMDRIPFTEFNLTATLQEALAEHGFTHATAIQEKVFSTIMAGADMCGIAQTGTGKTLAYLLPILRLHTFTKNKIPTTLVLVPTRELVQQVLDTIEMLTERMNIVAKGAYGGVNINTQRLQFLDKVDIVVATPGRLYDLAMHGVIKLSKIRKIVIDEVDELLALGFRPQLMNILELLPERRQNLMFSATLIPEVENLIDDFFIDPVKIETAPSGTPLENIQQSAYAVPNFNTKANLLRHLLTTSEEMDKVLVFTESKKMADLLFERLSGDFEMGIIHSNKDQNFRFRMVNAFENGDVKILIATDIVARGIDISDVTHVINTDAPDVAENYMHRIGRTGRAKAQGTAITFFTEKEEKYINAIEELMGEVIEKIDFPTEVEVSEELLPHEVEKKTMPEIQLRLPERNQVKAAFVTKKSYKQQHAEAAKKYGGKAKFASTQKKRRKKK